MIDVFSMTPPGRFIKKDKTSGQWLQVGIRLALEKAGRVLPDSVAKYNSQMPSLRRPSLQHHPSHAIATASSSIIATGQQKRRRSDMILSTSPLLALKHNSTSKQD